MRAVLPLLVLPLMLTACPKKGATSHTGGTVTEKALPEEGMILQEVDLDGNGRPEIRNFYRERTGGTRVMTRKEIDIDLDGKVDIVTLFDEDGQIKTEQIDSDFDGVFDWTDHYKDGARVLAESDTNFDGKPDIFSYYAIGDDGRPRLDRKERDTNGDGLIDFWERFDSEGHVVRSGRDTDGDGKMDERDE